MAIAPVLNTLNNVRIVAVAWNKDIQVRMMKVLIGIFLGIAAMWLLNIIGWKGLNLIPFFLGSMLLVVMGLSPITLGLVALTGTLFSRDQGQSIVDASTDEIKAWVTKVLPALLFGAHVLIGFLATWSFQDAPASFWMFAAAAMTIVSTLVVYDIKGRWLPFIVISYSLAIMAFALWPTVADDVNDMNPFASDKNENSEVVTAAPAATTTLPKLGADDFLDNVPGRFPAMTIAAGSRLGPVTDFDDSCMDISQGGGSGKLVIMTRPDFTSEPVRAIINPNNTLTHGFDGPAYQYFFHAEGGNVVLNLKRQDGDLSC